MVEYNNRVVFSSLKHGGFLKRKYKLIIALPFIICFTVLFTAIIIISATHDGFLLAMNNGYWGMFAILCVFAVAVLLIFISELRKAAIEREWKKWLTDDRLVFLETTPFLVEEHYNGASRYTKFGISFKYNGDTIVKYSQHFDNIYEIYKNSAMDILYSPKYDEVMVLKDDGGGK